MRTALNKVEAELAGCLPAIEGLKDIIGSPLDSVEDARAVLVKVDVVLLKITKTIESAKRFLKN